MRVGDETVVVSVPLKRPDACSLSEIDFRITDCREHPIARLGRFRRALRIARLLRFLHRGVWWYVRKVSASSRLVLFRDVRRHQRGKLGRQLVASHRPVAHAAALRHDRRRGADHNAADLRPSGAGRVRAFDGTGRDGADLANGHRRGADRAAASRCYAGPSSGRPWGAIGRPQGGVHSRAILAAWFIRCGEGPRLHGALLG